MKKLFAFFAFSLAALAASAPTFSLGALYVGRLQVDPGLDASGNVTSCNVQIFYKQDLINTSSHAHVVQDGFQAQATVDCVKDGAKTVTFQFAGQSYTMPYALIMTAAAAAALQEAPAIP